MTLDESKKENDIYEEYAGIKIVYDAKHANYLNGSFVDYTSNWYEEGFTIRGGGTSSC